MDRSCPYCESPITNPRAHTCGSKDCKRKKNTDQCRQWKAANRERANEIAREHRRSATGRASYERNRITRECEWCGKKWLASPNKKVRFCSKACSSYAASNTKSSPIPIDHPAMDRGSCAVPARHPSRVKVRKPRSFVSGRCVRCGDWFLAESYYEGAKYCSKQCAKAESKNRRRSLERGARVEIVRRDLVFARDGWVCQLCMKPVDREAQTPSHLAPTIDHVLPLSVGGRHTMDNAQTAHFICNSRKGARADYVHAA